MELRNRKIASTPCIPRAIERGDGDAINRGSASNVSGHSRRSSKKQQQPQDSDLVSRLQEQILRLQEELDRRSQRKSHSNRSEVERSSRTSSRSVGERLLPVHDPSEGLPKDKARSKLPQTRNARSEFPQTRSLVNSEQLPTTSTAAGNQDVRQSISGPSSELSQYFARQIEEKRNVPKFSGEPCDWANFISHFNRSTKMCNFSYDENLNRLQNCLIGKAKQAVYALLSHPENVPKILRILQRRFGRPELVIGTLRERLISIGDIKDNDFQGLIELSSEVQNYVSTVEVLDCHEYLFEPSMLTTLVGKLPFNVRVQWGEHLASLDISPARLNDFSCWLEKKADAYSLVAGGPCNTNSGTAGVEAKSNKNSEGTSVNKKCRFCDENVHLLADCGKWNKAPVQKRWSWAAKQKLCFRCLKSANHSAPQCRSQQNCAICHGTHHTTLHKRGKEAKAVMSTKDQSSTSVINVSTAQQAAKSEKLVPASVSEPANTVLLRVLPVRLYGPAGHIDTHALLDDGSSLTLIEAELAGRLGLKGKAKPLSMAWTGQMSREEPDSEMVDFAISSLNQEAKRYHIQNARTVRELALPSHTIDIDQIAKKWPFIMKGNIAAINGAQPKILIAQDNWPLLLTRKSFSGNWNGPVVSLTWLGWVLHGNLATSDGKGKFQLHHLQLSHWEGVIDEADLSSLHELVQQQILSESLDNSRPQQNTIERENETAGEIYQKTTARIGARWQTGLLWRHTQPLPESRTMAERRLHSLERKLQKDSILAERYKLKMEEYVEKGYARILTREEARIEGPKTWYLPHLGVVNPNKPNKLRICMDASAKSHGFCLNDFLFKGEDLFASLPGLLIRFRRFPVALVADIKEMYSQIRIVPEDQHAQRYLWRNLETHRYPDVYVFQSMMFGTVCSPYSAQMVLSQNALDFAKLYPDSAKAIRTNFYMDDYVDSVLTEQQAIKRVQEIQNIHLRGRVFYMQLGQ